VSGLIDWTLAGRVVSAGAGDSRAGMSSDLDLSAASSRSERAVLDYTGLQPTAPLPEPEWLTRSEWGRMSLAAMRELLAPIEGRIAESLPGPGRHAFAAVAGRGLAVEIGSLIALASRRVLGQYELSLAGIDRPPRLVFVGANIETAASELPGSPGEVLDWVALHETTHAVHFGSVPWLAGHLGELTSRLLREVPRDASLAGALRAARRALAKDPRSTLAWLRETDPMTLLAPAASRVTIAQVQATMAAIEGYAEHVMDAAAGHLGPSVPALRAAMERRRDSRGPIMRMLSWLLGFEMKLRQYRDGKRFADRVVAGEGIAGLNRAWSGPAALPRLDELGDPTAWLARTAEPVAAS
jgi:coenzyme F420 biosynthesis associated uncharacterized protein